MPRRAHCASASRGGRGGRAATRRGVRHFTDAGHLQGGNGRETKVRQLAHVLARRLRACTLAQGGPTRQVARVLARQQPACERSPAMTRPPARLVAAQQCARASLTAARLARRGSHGGRLRWGSRTAAQPARRHSQEPGTATLTPGSLAPTTPSLPRCAARRRP
jgi:hypothetical protein